MENAQVTFRLPLDRLKEIDQEAEADHRDRTSMLHKIIAFYFDHKTPAKKKAGIR
jgi:hypothetical protein